MRSVPALVAVALGAVMLASGCGHRHAGVPPGPPLSASSSAASLPSPVPGDPGTASCQRGSAAHAALITITYANNGQTLCVRRGVAVQVYLKGTPANLWTAIHVSNAAVLVPHANGRLMLMAGMTGASFLAVQPGTATIRSFRQPCGPEATPPNATAPGGGLECGVIMAFHATVKVS